MQATSTTKRWIVTGRVQGVGFRAATRAKARSLGIESGWARNLPDGSVEVCARGPGSSLAALERWLGEGPPLASVAAVRSYDSDATPPARFLID